MRFGYTILYVREVALSVDFYERAFGLKRRFVHESGQYAELETGPTALAFAAYELAAANLPGTFQPAEPGERVPTFEVCLVTEDVGTAYERAVREGAEPVTEPQTKPWGPDVAYLRDPDAVLIELASPVAG